MSWIDGPDLEETGFGSSSLGIASSEIDRREIEFLRVVPEDTVVEKEESH